LLVPGGGLTPGQTGRLTVGRSVTLTLTLTLACLMVKFGAGSRGPELLGNPEEEECSSLKATTRQRLVKL
jgi:hypothetical protein